MFYAEDVIIRLSMVRIYKFDIFFTDMAELPWNIGIIEFLAEHRNSILSPIFTFFTILGELNGYILVISGVYVLYNKNVGFRLAILAAGTATLNHLLKINIRNPRPFVSDGSYTTMWDSGVPDPAQTATEFSTPSGHAMGASSFYTYLDNKVRNTWWGLIFIMLIIMIGISRPYLGVHYLEDILLGWLIGLIVVFAFLKAEGGVSKFWNKLSWVIKGVIIFSVSAAIWVSIGLMTDWGLEGYTFATNTGFITGLLIGRRWEKKWVKFDPKSSNLVFKVLRLVITVGFTIGMMLALDYAFEIISGDDSLLGYALRYVRYSMVGLTAIFIAPFIFTKLKLAEVEE